MGIIQPVFAVRFVVSSAAWMYVRTGYDIIALANKTSTLWLFQDFGHFLAFFYVDFLVHLGRCLHLGLRFL